MSDATVIPASAAGNCRRALHYLVSATQPSDPPDAQAQNMMAMALHSRQAAIDAARREGWTVRDPDHTLECHPAKGVTLRLRQLHRVSHPDFTEDKPVMAVIATTTERRFDLLTEFGPLVSHRSEFDRLAIAADIAQERASSDFDPNEPQFLILLNRATGAIEYEPVEMDDLIDRAGLLKVRLHELADALATGDVPNREFERDSRPCSRCQWLTACHGAAPDPEPGESPVTEEQLEQSMAQYVATSAILKETKDCEKQHDAARAVLKRYVQEHGNQPVQVDCDGEKWRVSVSVSQKPAINQALARQRLSPQQLADITAPSGRETVRIAQVK